MERGLNKDRVIIFVSWTDCFYHSGGMSWIMASAGAVQSSRGYNSGSEEKSLMRGE